MNLTSGPPPTVLYNFLTYDDCGLGLTLGTDGNFYGACTKGGANGHGYVFQFVPSSRAFNEYSFSHAGTPSSRPIEATPGTFYGTTITGGNGYGTVYQITPPGPPTTLYSFTVTDGNYNDAYPNGPLFLGTDGNLYGTTQAGTDSSARPFPMCPGTHCGAIYNISPAGGAPNFLYTFTGAPSDGGTPTRGVIEGSDLNFYGTTVQGGADNLGTIFQWTPGSPPVILYSFITSHYGYPRGLTELPYLNFYGDANGCSIMKGCFDDGTIFEFTTTSGFIPTVELMGKVAPLGSFPDSTLSHTNGTLYGVTGTGGKYNDGVFYSLTPSEAPTDEETQFCRPQLPLGQEGGQVYILGQNFSQNSSEVYFGGVQATAVTVNETGTLITATIPPGAQTGPVTVNTGSTTLTSLLPFTVTD
jgi:uncharacterized repeat protein (TIGR03803 family)